MNWLGLLGLFWITTERLKCSKAITYSISELGLSNEYGYGMEISVGILILRAPLCVVNKDTEFLSQKKQVIIFTFWIVSPTLDQVAVK